MMSPETITDRKRLAFDAARAGKLDEAEAILREIFPIKSFNGEIALEYVGYELGRSRYTADECRRLRLTYGAPFKVRVFSKPQTLTPKIPNPKSFKVRVLAHHRRLQQTRKTKALPLL